MSINAEWHRAHRMPKNASFDERVRWHIEHVANCSCRKIPKKLAAKMEEKGIAYPADKVDR